jgi:hypothetical protein
MVVAVAGGLWGQNLTAYGQLLQTTILEFISWTTNLRKQIE